MFENFTQKAIKTIVLAQDEARRLGHDFIGTEFILLGLISEGTGVAATMLRSFGVNLELARTLVEKSLGRGQGSRQGEIPFTPRAVTVFQLSLAQAELLGQNQTNTEHLLLGILLEGEGLAVRVLENLRVDLHHLEQQLRVTPE